MVAARSACPALLSLFIAMTAGCTGSTENVGSSISPDQVGNRYLDDDWAEVLRSYTWNGLVNYQGLAQDRRALDRYCALLSKTGPTATPDQFSTAPLQTAYWINAFNALTVKAVLLKYPMASMYDLGMPQLEHDYAFTVDGRRMTLGQIEQAMLASSRQDPRTLMATCRACLGSPRLLMEPYHAAALERQLRDVSASAMVNPFLLRIDHEDKSILVWQEMIRRKELFLNYWRRVRRSRTTYLFNVLLELSSPGMRRRLQSAVGYQVREIPFDRRLNDTTTLRDSDVGSQGVTRDRPIVP